MTVKIDKLTKDMVSIVGKEHAISDLASRIVFAQDPQNFDLEEHNIPYVVVRPSKTEEVSQILKYANEKKINVHTHGSGSSFAGLARPKINCILLDTRRMNKMEVFPERGFFEVGPGAHLAEVEKELAKYNAMLPINLGSQLIASIGGAVSVNTSGHMVDAAIGKPGDFVLGLEVVLPTGEILQTGSESPRRPAGVELTRLFIGSEGLLDIKTKIRMRLVPLAAFQNIVVYYDHVDGILDTVMEMYKRCIPAPVFYEFLDEKSAKIGFQAVGLPEPAGPVSMIRIANVSKAGSEELSKEFLEFLKFGKPTEIKLVTDNEEWTKLWTARAEFANYLFRGGLTWWSEISTRADKLKEAFHEVEALAKGLQSYENPEFYSYGHIGAPTIHARVFWPKKDIPIEDRKAIGLEWRTKTEEINIKYFGCGGEVGLTASRVNSFIRKKYGEQYYEILVKLKNLFDPEGILNKGNLEGWA
ncbi:glycolate oxidase [Desulfosarcina sp. BuS5]|uniref:FAD-binding oxidoreductase n=1 Tax=Desulfosarcina sp. BuS5 TaxID=933262 RepID=UPI00048107C4|nr:FAD-binding oxidoreductase [Desulfosarcina sp. BuS5]WDN87550.1 glycolate oxidase [Desulfosarcina sp. BuS5]